MLIIQRSQIAAFSVFRPLAPCLDRPYIPSCAEHGAGVGRSSTGRPYGAARKSRSGKSVGAVDETATDSATFFGPNALRGATTSGSSRIAAMHPPRPPSIDQGVMAFIWAAGSRYLHLLRAHRRRAERRDCDRDHARLVRRDLAPRPPARREAGAPAPPTLIALPRLPGGRSRALRARRRACARARSRGSPRAVPAPGQPSGRGSASALRGAVLPDDSSPGQGRSSHSCVSEDLPL